MGAKSLWRSVDAKATTPSWAAIKAPSAVSGNYISAIAVAPGNSNLIWVGHNNGDLYCTINGTVASPTWTKVNTINARWLMSLRVDQSNSNRVFATYGGFNPGNVQELTDPVQVCKAAPTVTNRQGNLPAAPTRSLMRHPTNSDWLYVGTDIGLFASVNGGASWSASNDGPASVAVFELFFLDSATLVAVTHGRGMFKTSVVTPVYATLDIDQNGSVDAATDGVMVLRYLLGLTGSAVTAGATGGNANRTDSQLIYAYLTSIRPQLDIDGNNQINAAPDGLLILRYLRQLRGDALVMNVLGSGTVRSTIEIENHLLGLTQ